MEDRIRKLTQDKHSCNHFHARFFGSASFSVTLSSRIVPRIAFLCALRAFVVKNEAGPLDADARAQTLIGQINSLRYNQISFRSLLHKLHHRKQL